MTVHADPVLRSVVLPAPDAHPQETPTRRLLNELGHDVSRASSPEHAIELLSADLTDLLVVDMGNGNVNRRLMSQLADLPAERRPRQLAVYSDRMDAELAAWRRQISPSEVHVFVKPLHMHGLLSVLRQMEKRVVHECDASSCGV
jgi:hypothetical protein